jgi:hypothetical protein
VPTYEYHVLGKEIVDHLDEFSLHGREGQPFLLDQKG